MGVTVVRMKDTADGDRTSRPSCRTSSGALVGPVELSTSGHHPAPPSTPATRRDASPLSRSSSSKAMAVRAPTPRAPSRPSCRWVPASWLGSLVPRPRTNQVLYRGVLAAHSAIRPHVVPQPEQRRARWGALPALLRAGRRSAGRDAARRVPGDRESHRRGDRERHVPALLVLRPDPHEGLRSS
jgi:hypothetical protein